MELLFSILVILFAVIAFLILYFTTLKKDRKNQEYRLPFREAKTEYESGEDFSMKTKDEFNRKIEEEFAEEIGPELNTHEEIDLKQVEEFTIEISPELDLQEGISLKEEREGREQFKKDQEEEADSFIRLFTRDPRCLYTYWQITKEDFYTHPFYLRLHNLSDNKYTDIEVREPTGNWYLKAEPDKVYKTSIGYFKEGIFFPIVSSRFVQTPLEHPSKIIDVHWMTIEELSSYTFRVEMDSLSIIKNIEGRKIQEELDADSLSIIKVNN